MWLHARHVMLIEQILQLNTQLAEAALGGVGMEKGKNDSTTFLTNVFLFF